MKKNLIVIVILLISSIDLYSQCGTSETAGRDAVYTNWRYKTSTLLNGSAPEIITPTSSYSVYKLELIAPSGYILKSELRNPEDYYFNGTDYIYSIRASGTNLCNYSGEHGYSFALRVRIINYIPWYFGGFIQDTLIQSPFPIVCNESPYHAIRNRCDSDDDNDNNDPNLSLKGFTVKVGSTTYDVYANTNNVPKFKNGEEHTFEITIENNDDGNASSAPYELLVSKSPSNPNTNATNPYYTFRNDNAGSIVANSEKSDSFSEYIYANIAGMPLQTNTDYYMHILLDNDEDIDESDEDDNWRFFKFKYEENSGGIINLDLGYDSIKIPIANNHSNQSVKLRIYNTASSRLVYSKMVKNRQTVDISFFPSGLYAIHVNNKYVKKIAKRGGIRLY